ncbi:MAG: serine/threonine protein kinase [Labilithrix sp.]|nr:serine/threonine protein kinase [Labilithrix sp.]MCW5809941.1 serine/threonine protein kinase [Labilithrix sp.]
MERLATSDTADVLLAKAEGPMGFERTVVLKVLLEHLMSDEGSAGAFAREAAAYARLADPAIVTLYEFSEHRGRLVMALEHVDGAPLADVLAVLAQAGRSLDDKTALYVAQRIFAALATAHRAPIIHRDVNPSNVLLSWDGEVKLTDFGFARFMGATHQSAFGMIKGTFGYMAPEQIEGGAITSRTDIYAAGIVLWELLTHQTAFVRGRLSEIEALTMMAEPQLASLDELRPDLPQRLRNAVTRALRPRSEDRDVSASEMVSILRGLIPTDIGREKLATWLEQLRPHLAVASESEAEEEDSTVSAYEPPRASRPDVPRAKSSSGTSETAFSPHVTAKLAEQSRPALAVRHAPAPIEETTQVIPQPPPQPQPRPSAPEPTFEPAPVTAPVPATPPTPAAPPPWSPPAGAATAQPSWAPPIITTAPPQPTGGRRTGLIAGLALGLVVLGGAATAMFFTWHRTVPPVVPPATASPAVAASSVPTPPETTASTSTSSSVTTVSSTPPAVSASAPPPPPTASSAPPPEPPAPAVPPDMTLLRTEGSNVGRRIFVDGRSVGQTPSSVTVKCGPHELRIGSSGVVKQMDLPCGGEVTVTDR